MSRAKFFTPVYMLFLLFAKNCGYFYRHYSHMPLHSTNDGLRKSIGVLHGRYFHLFTSTTSSLPQKSNAFVSDLHISERTVTNRFASTVSTRSQMMSPCDAIRLSLQSFTYKHIVHLRYGAVLGVSFLIY